MLSSNISKFSMTYHRFSEFFSTFGFRCPKELNPFLNLDIFHMSEPTFPPHPHAGFSAVTYLFPSSMGEFQNRDSKGDKSIIEAGGIHWTQAAKGMLHEEIPTRPGVDCFGLQMFIKLPRTNESDDGEAFHVSPSDLAHYTSNGLILRVLSGSYKDKTSHLTKIHPNLDFYDISLDQDKKFPIRIEQNKICLIVCVSGEIEIDGKETLKENQILVFQTIDFEGEIVGRNKANQFLFLSAERLEEDYVWGGPFCLSSVDKLDDAKNSFQQGKMGTLTPSF